MKHKEAIAKRIESYLKENDWTFEYDDVHGVFSLEADLECKFEVALVVYQATEKGYLCYTTLLEDAKQEIIPTVAEYLHRANYGLPNGNFELDYDSGAIDFKTHFDCEKGVPTKKQLEDSVTIGLSALEYYGNGLYEIMHGTSIAKQLISEVEQ